MLEILPVRGIGDVRPNDDLAALIADAAPWLRDGDILVVTSKIVSKSEGRLVDAPTAGPEREAARDEALQAETARPVARRGPTRIVQTHHGFVMAAAGIDTSNVDASHLVLLPKDPDSSARALRAALRERTGLDVAVVISDTMGRPWRLGLVDVALGAAGIDALRDHRGEVDPYGNELQITQVAVIDELAAAAELVKGKCDGVPVAVVRGLAFARSAEDRGGVADGGAAVLIRAAEQDLFSLGTAEARALGLREAATLAHSVSAVDTPAHSLSAVDTPAYSVSAVDTPAYSVSAADTPVAVPADAPTGLPVDQDAVERALALVRPMAARTTVFTVDGNAITCALADDAAAMADPEALVALGADVHRLRAALLAEGIASAWRPATDVGTGSIGRISVARFPESRAIGVPRPGAVS